MCQVCENPYRICEFGNTGFYINKMENGEYRFKMMIDECTSGKHTYYESLSTPISYCPYCGRDLTIEIEQPTKYWDYLKSLDDSETIKTLLDLGKKWQNEGKDLDYELTKYMKW